MYKILVIKTHAMGDVIMATPAIRELRRAYPSAHISILIGTWSKPIIQYNKHINEIIEFDDSIVFHRNIIKVACLLFKIRKKKFDTVFIFHPSIYVHLFSLLAGIKNRYGLRRGKKGHFLTGFIDESTSPNFYYPINFLTLLSCVGIHSNNYEMEVNYSEKDKISALNLLHSCRVKTTDTLVLIAPGGSHNPKETIGARQWPKEYFVDLIDILFRKHPHISILLCGAENDKCITQYIIDKTKKAIDLTGKTSITELIAIVEMTSVVICNDSSLLHIALAKNIPTICFFGPTGLKSRMPESKAHYSFQSNVECSPCYKFGNFPGCTEKYACMHSITVDVVSKTISKLLTKDLYIER